jgi:nitrite reductase/ring-hydroxylating ferredoxin subunit
MDLAWDDFPDAPASGTTICDRLAVAENEVLSLSLGDFPVLISNLNGQITVFVNACPHQFLPLDQRGDVISANGARLICSNHHAEFDRETGTGVAGEGVGCRLAVVPTAQSRGVILVA